MKNVKYLDTLNINLLLVQLFMELLSVAKVFTEFNLAEIELLAWYRIFSNNSILFCEKSSMWLSATAYFHPQYYLRNSDSKNWCQNYINVIYDYSNNYFN